jgi:hypothetical protein
MTIGIIQKCTLLKSCCNSQNQATFNFNNLPSHENYFACLFLGFLLWQAANPNQRNSRDPQQIPLENKVVNKIIAPK